MKLTQIINFNIMKGVTSVLVIIFLIHIQTLLGQSDSTKFIIIDNAINSSFCETKINTVVSENCWRCPYRNGEFKVDVDKDRKIDYIVKGTHTSCMSRCGGNISIIPLRNNLIRKGTIDSCHWQGSFWGTDTIVVPLYQSDTLYRKSEWVNEKLKISSHDASTSTPEFYCGWRHETIKDSTTFNIGLLLDTNESAILGYLSFTYFLKDQKHAPIFRVNSLYTTCLSSLKEYSDQNLIEIFPNPTKDYITTISKSNHPLSYKLYSLQGKLITAKKSLKKMDVIDLSNLKQGVYFIEVNKGREVFTKKIIKL